MKFEPVVILDLVKYVLVSLTALGVVTLDSATQQWLVGIVGAVLTLVTTVLTRGKVTPVAASQSVR